MDSYTAVDTMVFGDLYLHGKPLQTLRNFVGSPSVNERELYVKAFECVLQKESPELINRDKDEILATLEQFSKETEVKFRSNLSENLIILWQACIAQFDPTPGTFGGGVLNTILSIALRYLTDQVRVTAGAYHTIVYLIENGFLDSAIIERDVCPVVIELCSMDQPALVDTSHRHSNAVGVMAKIAPIIGQQKTYELFYERFINISKCQVYFIRKLCARVFPVMCEVLGTTITEEYMLPEFLRLCSDEVWGIRKQCALVLPMMALLVSLDSRRRYLVPAMKRFLFDDSEWVIIEALRELGQFIPAFAQPQIYGLAYNYRLDLFITNAAYDEFRPMEPPQLPLLYGNQPNSAVIMHNMETYVATMEAALGDMDPVVKEALRAKNEKLDVDEYLRSLVMQARLERTSERRSSIASLTESDDTGISVLSETVSDYLRYDRKSFSTPVPPSYSEKSRGSPFNLNSEDEIVARFLKHCLPLTNNFSEGPMTEYSTHTHKDSSNDDMEVMPRRSGSLTSSAWRREAREYNLSRGYSKNDDSFLADLDFRSKKKSEDKLPPPLPPADNGNNNSTTESGRELGATTSAAGDSANNNTASTVTSKTEGDNNNDNVFDDQRLPSPPPPLTAAGDLALPPSGDDEDLAEFNSHRYWYIPPPALDLNVINSNTTSTAAPVTPSSSAGTSSSTSPPDDTKHDYKMDDFKRTSSCDSTVIVTSDNDDIIDVLNDGDSDCSRKGSRVTTLFAPELFEGETELCLIEDFIYMKDIDTEMLLATAYCFPAVLFTYGARFWPLFRNNYIDLCYNCHLNVRQSLAASISHVALIIGRENATNDLVDPYVEFLRDSEDVKTQALHNMSGFIKVIDPAKHSLIINQLSHCLIPAKKIMWRFREALGYQVMELMKIHDKINREYCLPYLIGLAARLMCDQYDCVRKVGVQAFIEGFRQVNKKVEVLHFFRDQFALNMSWKRRQLYILTVDKMLATNSITAEMFNDHVLEYLLNLSTQSVPNIRLYAGLCLSTTVLMNDYFKEETLHEMIGVRVYELKNDKDRDVRDNTTLAHVSDEVIKLAEMVTKFDALEAKLNEMESAAAERAHYNQREKMLQEEARDLDSTVSNSGDSLEDSPPRPTTKLSDDEDEEEGDDDDDGDANYEPPLPEPMVMSGNENLPTLQWQVPPMDTAPSASAAQTASDGGAGGALQKGFKFFFGTLDPSETAEPGEQVDIAEEATIVGNESENTSSVRENEVVDSNTSTASSSDTKPKAAPEKETKNQKE